MKKETNKQQRFWKEKEEKNKETIRNTSDEEEKLRDAGKYESL